MRSKKSVYAGIVAVVGMVLLILDTKTAISGAAEGIEICIRTVIPSLFPFFFLTKIITASSGYFSFRFLRPIGLLCKIPEGSESLLFLGWFGGYPIGAQVMESAVTQGVMDIKSAERMLGFCNNPGPAFIFGITGLLFDKPYIPWILWGILILSALLTGMILHCQSSHTVKQIKIAKPNYMTDALKAMASVCGWIVLFRTLLNILSRWILWLVPVSWQVLLTGLLEISNGCIGLSVVESQSIRFILASVILCTGGLCVAMQTASVSPSLNHKSYFIGKLIQTLFVIPLSQLTAFLIFGNDIHIHNIIILAICIMTILIYYMIQRISAKNLTRKYQFDIL